jgi:cation/acetate symporter
MAEEDTSRDFTSNIGRIYLVYTGGFAAFVLFLAALEQFGVSNQVIGYLFVFFTLAIYAGIGILSRTMQVGEYYVAGRRVPAVYNGMATASDWMSGASFVGMAGTLYVLGYDGLAFVIGWTGGYVLVAVLVAPYLRKFGAYTIPDFLGARYGGHMARTIGILILFCCSFTYVTAQIYATGIIASRFLGMSFELAVFVGLLGILVCSMLGGMRAVTWTQVAQYIVLIVAYLVPVILLAQMTTGVPVPQVMYGEILQEITALETSLVEKGLAKASEITPHLQPYSSYDTLNFFALVLCLMVGTASLPHILMRYFTTPSVKDARRSVGWSLLFIFFLYFTAPAYAAFAKLEIYQNVIGAPLEELPGWIYTYGQIGLVKICGIEATTLEAVRAACLAKGDTTGILSFSDFSINRDVIVIATPEIAGLPYVVAGLVAAGGLAAALSTADGLLLAIANALSHDIYYRMVDPKASTKRRLIIARVMLVGVAGLAAWVASTKPSDILSMVAWAFSLAAAGFFPALVLGIWWKRASAAGAIAGMVSGFGLTLFYLIATQYGGMTPWLGIQNISAGIFGMPLGFAVTWAVSLMTAPPSPKTEAMIEAIRVPKGGTYMDK